MIYKRSFIEAREKEREGENGEKRSDSPWIGRFLQLTKNISLSRPVDT